MVVGGAQAFLTRLEISDLPCGMTILAFSVSIEELASGCMLTKRVARWAECVLIFLYTAFVVGG